MRFWNVYVRLAFGCGSPALPLRRLLERRLRALWHWQPCCSMHCVVCVRVSVLGLGALIGRFRLGLFSEPAATTVKAAEPTEERAARGRGERGAKRGGRGGRGGRGPREGDTRPVRHGGYDRRSGTGR
jgi:hypothetical protein